MGLRREICWMTAMRDLRSDRAAPSQKRPMLARSLRLAQLIRAVEEAASHPLCREGRYNRSAIMTYALALARRERCAAPALSWRRLVSSALKMVWTRARQALDSAHSSNRTSTSEVSA